ncbi:hypothetical protein [Bradyrhizobium sp. 5.13L]
MTVRPLTDLLRITAAPMIWFVHLTSIYSAEAVICTGILPVRLSMGWIVVGFTIIAIIGLAATAAITAKGGRTSFGTAEQSGAWLRSASLLLILLSAIGVGWTSLPSFLLPGCDPAAGPLLGMLL